MSDKEELEKAFVSVTDQEQELAKNALNEFKKKNYLPCLQSINKLSEIKGDDFKVAHNKAVVEFCKGNFRKCETFQRNLNTICSQVEKLDDVDQCIVHYNQAILLYHQRQFTAAIRIMDRVFKFIAPMDVNLAKQVSLFNIELQLCVRQPEKALGLINYVENQLINGTPNIKLLEIPPKEKDKKVTPPIDPRIDPSLEEFKKKLLKYKVRCYLMNHSLDLAGKEIKLLTKTPNVLGLFLTANLEYLRGNYMESQKILASIKNDSLVFNECGESSTILFYNNMGVLHHSMGKPNLACHYFQMALKEDIAVASITKKDLNEKAMWTLGGSKYHEMMYNLGISLLHAKRATQAFDCLIIAVRRYHRNSRLWMRLAECCMMVNKESNENDFDIQKLQKELIVDIVGTQDKQKVILTTNLSKDKKYSVDSQSYAVPVPSLEFASLCLRNAYVLLPTETPTLHTSVSLFFIPAVTPAVPSPNPGPAPSSPLPPEEVTKLKNCILAASAYVCLCLGDYILALEHATELLNQPRLSGAHKLLAHMYAAESLILLDKISEALEHLNPENIKTIDLDLPPAEEQDSDEFRNKTRTAPPTKWFPSNLSCAQATMQYNIAVAKTIRGQLDDAISLLKQVWQMNGKCKVPGHIIMLVLYIELQLGHPEPARNLIKQNLYQSRMAY